VTSKADRVSGVVATSTVGGVSAGGPAGKRLVPAAVLWGLVFVVLAATAVTTTAWVLVAGFAAHGVKDAWQERSHYVANTR
jgi:hypothetical protein